jgi:hypoxanthine phosphoribosyltransferase
MNEPLLRFSEEEIARRVSELGLSIRRDAGETSPIVLIPILKGTAVFFADLLRAIPGPVSYHFIDVIQDESDTEVAEATELNFLTHFDIKLQNVYILKDVVSTGVIETYLLSQFRQRQPATLHLVALLDRPELRTAEITVDYSAFQVGAGIFVGYGLESRGSYGNLRYLATL